MISDIQSALADLTAEAIRRRTAGAPADEVAAVWSGHVRSLIDVPLAPTGSVGRGEATPRSDVDVVRLRTGPTPVFDRLRRVGRIDEKGVTGEFKTVPQEEARWRELAPVWADAPEKNLAVVKLGILADVAHPVREAAAAAVPGSRMIPAMLNNCLSVQAPKLGLRAWSLTNVAVKDQLLTPIVKLARWGALSSGSSALTTPDRLAAVAPFALSRTEAEELAEAYALLFAIKFDLDLGLLMPDDEHYTVNLTDHRGRLLLTALPLDRAQAVIAAADVIRGVQEAAALRLTGSTFATGNNRNTLP